MLPLKASSPADNQPVFFLLRHIFVNQIKVEQALSSHCSSCQRRQQPLLRLLPPASTFFPAFPHVLPSCCHTCLEEDLFNPPTSNNFFLNLSFKSPSQASFCPVPLLTLCTLPSCTLVGPVSIWFTLTKTSSHNTRLKKAKSHPPEGEGQSPAGGEPPALLQQIQFLMFFAVTALTVKEYLLRL